MKTKILIPLIVVISLLLAFIGYKKGEIDTVEKYQNLNIEYHKRQIEIKESRSIFDFVKVYGYLKKEREGAVFNKYDAFYADLSITNEASFAEAKNIKIQVTFISKTDKNISNIDFTVYELIKPGGSVTFKKRIYPPKEMKTISLKIINIE